MITVKILPHNQEHLAKTYEWLKNSDTLSEQIDTLAPPISSEINNAVWRKRWADPTRHDFAIFASGEHVGNCGLANIDVSRRKAQLWVYVGDGRGRRVGSNAVSQLLSYAFKDLALHRIYIRVLETNFRAISFYKKLGFSFEGILRHDTFQYGKPIDSIAMAILADE